MISAALTRRKTVPQLPATHKTDVRIRGQFAGTNLQILLARASRVATLNNRPGVHSTTTPHPLWFPWARG